MPETSTKPSPQRAPSRRADRPPADRHPAQAPARAFVPAADGHAAALLPRRLAAGARLRRRLRRDHHRADGQGRAARRRVGLGRVVPRGQAERRVRLPRDRAAVRPLGALRGARAAPRPAADRLLALPGHGRRADLRAGQRRAVLELLHLLRHALLRDRVRVDDPLGIREGHRRAAAGGRLPAPRGAGRLRQAHRGRPPRARRRGARAGRHDRLHLAGRRGPTTGCARSGGSRTSPRCSTATACRR